MFKPFIGDCKQCTRKLVIIPVKAGICQYCNHENKQQSKAGSTRTEREKHNRGNDSTSRGSHENSISTIESSAKLQEGELSSLEKRKTIQNNKPQTFKKRKPIQYRRKRTGEAEIFKEIWKERDHICSCCNTYLGTEASPIFFSHLLAKGTYGLYRLHKENIWLKCEHCHSQWEFGDRSQGKFTAAVDEAARLKREYYEFTRVNKIINHDNDTGQDISTGSE